MPKFQVVTLAMNDEEELKDFDDLMELRVFIESEAYKKLSQGIFTTIIITRIE